MKHLYYIAFVVNHSKSYTIAVIASAIEYWVEIFFFGNKAKMFFIIIGLICVSTGQVDILISYLTFV